MEDTRKQSETLPFEALLDTGIMWLINTTVFHPRGMALALDFDSDGNPQGWHLYVDEEAWVFPADIANERFRAFNKFIDLIEKIHG